MKLSSCPVCDRLVRRQSPSCPFCGTRLGTTPSLTRVMITAAVGLTLSACVDKGTSDTSVADEGSTTGATTSPTTGFTDGATSTTPMTSSEGGHGYDGAGDTYTGPGIPPDETEGKEPTSSSSGDTDGSSTSGTDGSSTSGTDSGTSGTGDG